MGPVGVIGFGSFGKTIVKLLAINSEVLVYTRTTTKVDTAIIEDSLEEGTQLKPIHTTNDLEELCNKCQVIFPVIPSKFVRTLAKSMSPYINPSHYIIHCIKGLDYNKSDDLTIKNVHTISQVFLQETACIRIGCLSGPNLSKEIMANLPAASVVASEFEEVIDIGKKLLSSKRFFIFGSNQLLGTELSGAFKNVIAIASGIINQKEFGKNIEALLITRGLHEFIDIGKQVGADTSAFLGIAGIGDLIATATSPNSRNFTLGRLIAQGKSIEEASEIIGEVAEGVNTLEILKHLSSELKLTLPISNMLYYVVFENYPIEKVIDKLTFYPAEYDVEFDLS